MHTWRDTFRPIDRYNFIDICSHNFYFIQFRFLYRPRQFMWRSFCAISSEIKISIFQHSQHQYTVYNTYTRPNLGPYHWHETVTMVGHRKTHMTTMLGTALKYAWFLIISCVFSLITWYHFGRLDFMWYRDILKFSALDALNLSRHLDCIIVMKTTHLTSYSIITRKPSVAKHSC